MSFPHRAVSPSDSRTGRQAEMLFGDNDVTCHSRPQFLWRSVLDAHDAHICLTAIDGRIIFVNRAWRDFARHNGCREPGAFLGGNYLDLCRGSDCPEAALVSVMLAQVARGEVDSRDMVYPCHSPDEHRWFRLHVSRIDDDGIRLLMISHQNVSAIRAAADLAERAALVDDVLGILTRRGLKDSLAIRGSAILVAAGLEDLPDLVTRHGQGCADEMVRAMMTKLAKALPDDAVIGHVGGRDFAVGLPPEKDLREVRRLVDTIVAVGGAPVPVGSRILASRIVCGVAVGEHGLDSETLIARAGRALGAAREKGGQLQFHSPLLEQRAERRASIESDLHRAAHLGQLSMVYQPQVDGAGRQLIGAEALLRWRHPTLGAVSPAEFIPIAEAAGLIDTVGDWVLEQVCRDRLSWRQAGLAAVPVAVNVSVGQLRDDGFAQRLAATIARHGLTPPDLPLELTETALVDESDPRVTRNIRQLSEAGFTLSVDDFGTGYSNLARLRTLSVQTVKIDRSFVIDLETSHEARALAASVVQLAAALHLDVLAEGVESQSQRQILLDMGCRRMQGFLFSQPVSAVAFAALLPPQAPALSRPTTA